MLVGRSINPKGLVPLSFQSLCVNINAAVDQAALDCINFLNRMEQHEKKSEREFHILLRFLIYIMVTC
jgi:hypothetical protein